MTQDFFVTPRPFKSFVCQVSHFLSLLEATAIKDVSTLKFPLFRQETVGLMCYTCGSPPSDDGHQVNQYLCPSVEEMKEDEEKYIKNCTSAETDCALTVVINTTEGEFVS